MKKIVIGIFVNTIFITTAFANCTYPFDATASQINQVFNGNGATTFPSMQVSKGSFTIAPSSTTTGAAAFSSSFANSVTQSGQGVWNSAGDKPIAATGITAFEYKLKIPNYTLPVGETITIFPATISGTSGNTNAFKIVIGQINYSATDSTDLFIGLGEDGNAKQFREPLNTSQNVQTFGLYVNQTTKQIGYTFNGVNKGYVANYSTLATAISAFMILMVQPVANNASIVGKNIVLELVTDHASLTEPFPSGSKDVCGNAI